MLPRSKAYAWPAVPVYPTLFGTVNTKPISEYEGGPTKDRYFTFNFLPRFDLDNKVDGVFNFVFEVTEQVTARKKIEESEIHFRHLADLVPAKISNALPSGEVTFFNQQWLDFAGMAFEDLRDFGYHQMMHPSEVEEFQQKLQEAAAAKKPLVMEMRFKDISGKYIWHLNIASPILDENGEIAMWVGSTTDIQLLKEEEQRKADFISMLSHELKTPVTSIKGYIQLMQREITRDIFAPEKFALSLDRVDRLVVQLTNLVSDMLDLSRIESARLDLKKKREDVGELVKEVVQDFKLTNPSRKIDFELQGDFFAEIDQDKIAQVLINLISNAIKYSKENTPINISVFQKQEEKVSISIQDYGIGIDQKEHYKIFERFYRVEGKAENHFSGFGIGLYLAHSIVARHNGTITLDSTPGHGSTFTLLLPLG
jgi:PAS domain S-box-containing protein